MTAQTVVRRSDTASVASALRLSVMRLARRLRAERSDGNYLSATQLAAIATLDRHGPLTPGELAAHEKVQPPSMTKTIAALEDKGLVMRTPHPTDRRQVVVAISRGGTRLLAEDRRRRDAWLAQRLRELTPAELATLGAAAVLLDRLATA
jgi:DNA-binding MarR family transcriptional regulator